MAAAAPQRLLPSHPRVLTQLVYTAFLWWWLPWPFAAVVGVLQTAIFVGLLSQRGLDPNHRPIELLDAYRPGIWTPPPYHALHHVYPNAYYSAYTKLIDVLVRGAAQLRERRFLLLEGGGPFARELEAALRSHGVEAIERRKLAAHHGQIPPDLESLDVLVICDPACDVATLAEPFVAATRLRQLPARGVDLPQRRRRPGRALLPPGCEAAAPHAGVQRDGAGLAGLGPPGRAKGGVPRTARAPLRAHGLAAAGVARLAPLPRCGAGRAARSAAPPASGRGARLSGQSHGDGDGFVIREGSPALGVDGSHDLGLVDAKAAAEDPVEPEDAAGRRLLHAMGGLIELVAGAPLEAAFFEEREERLVRDRILEAAWVFAEGLAEPFRFSVLEAEGRGVHVAADQHGFVGVQRIEQPRELRGPLRRIAVALEVDRRERDRAASEREPGAERQPIADAALAEPSIEPAAPAAEPHDAWRRERARREDRAAVVPERVLLPRVLLALTRVSQPQLEELDRVGKATAEPLGESRVVWRWPVRAMPRSSSESRNASARVARSRVAAASGVRPRSAFQATTRKRAAFGSGAGARAGRVSTCAKSSSSPQRRSWVSRSHGRARRRSRSSLRSFGHSSRVGSAIEGPYPRPAPGRAETELARSKAI